MSTIQYYSQFGQDNWLHQNIFKNKKNGYFIDLGCAHYKVISNTLVFEETLDWSGIAFDCQIEHVNSFNQYRKNKAVLAAVSNIEDLEVEIVCGGGATGILDDTSNKYIKSNIIAGNETFKLTTTTLTKLLIDNCAPSIIDFLSLDVEGHELQVLQGIDFNKFQINIILVEKNSITNLDIDKLLVSKDYTKLNAPLPADWVYVINNYKEYYNI